MTDASGQPGPYQPQDPQQVGFIKPGAGGPPPGQGYQPSEPGYPNAPAPYPNAPMSAHPSPMGPPGPIRSVGTCILLAIVTLGIYTFVWVWKTHDEIKNHSGNGIGGPIGFVIYLLVSPVTWFIVPMEIRDMMARNGQTSRVTPIWGLWFLLPIIGAFVWFIRVQEQLNDYWRSVGALG
jgi:hypothetical protein